ncbi:MAG: VOC family protein [Anaerolineales bacterium]|nr:VOC family protein [Anaerolineales bacterium]
MSSAFPQSMIFLRCADLERTTAFYLGILGLALVRDQGTCRIFRVNPGAFLGFCTHLEGSQPKGLILTLVSEDVDGWHARLSAQGVEFLSTPAHDPHYQIYHCFLRDPDGYLLEIQRFDRPLD